jgi:hypothetical protein
VISAQIDAYRKSWSAKMQRKYPDPSKPAKSWSFGQRKMVHSCFFNGGKPWMNAAKNTNAPVPSTECRACTVCPKNFFQSQACNPAKHADTVCKPCTICKDFQYTARPCQYGANTMCRSCRNCFAESAKKRTFLFQVPGKECTIHLNRDPYKRGNGGMCRRCRMAIAKGTFVAKPCKPGKYQYVRAKQMVGGGTRLPLWMRKRGLGKYQSRTVGGWKLLQTGQNLTPGRCGSCPAGQYVAANCKQGVNSALKCHVPTGEKYRFHLRNLANCGPFKVGKPHKCAACRKNNGCDKKRGGEVCKTGQFLDKKTQLQKFEFRTRRCDNRKLSNGDARYGRCTQCRVHQFARRQCTAQCTGRRTGVCAYRNWSKVTTKKCSSDKMCGKNMYCKGMCMAKGLVGGKLYTGSNEDGDMRKNKRGVNAVCSSCPNRFEYGKRKSDNKPLYAYSKGLRNRCAVQDKLCNYAPDWKRPAIDAFGMAAPPAYSTCTGKCTVSKTSDKPIPQKVKFGNCCKPAKAGQPAALGSACEWTPYVKQCRTPFMSDGRMKGLPYRKRTKKTGSYKGFRVKGLDPTTGRRYPLKNDGPHNFVRWCKQLCEDFPGCTMFQVERCLIEGTCKVQDSTECDLFNISDDDRNNDHVAPLEKELLKKMKNGNAQQGGIDAKDWTCAMGAAVFKNHRNADPSWNTAGFECKGEDMTGIKMLEYSVVDGVKVAKDAKCGTPMCQGAAKKCCVRNKHVCYTKPIQMRKHQA